MRKKQEAWGTCHIEICAVKSAVRYSSNQRYCLNAKMKMPPSYWGVGVEWDIKRGQGMMDRTGNDISQIQTCSTCTSTATQWLISFGMNENETKLQNDIFTTFPGTRKLPETMGDGTTDWIESGLFIIISSLNFTKEIYIYIYMCSPYVFCEYLLCIYKYTHIHVYIFQKHILSLYN